MNDYRLKVTGLKAGDYEVRLGGKKVAEYTAEELAKGVNLAAAALKAGPIAEQVKAVKDGGRGQEPVSSTTASSAAWCWPTCKPPTGSRST